MRKLACGYRRLLVCRAIRCGHAAAEPTAVAVRRALEGILASDGFVASERLRSFLRFVVEEALAGRAEPAEGLHHRRRGVRSRRGLRPADDPVVRVEAGRLRRRLERYYLGREHDPVRIDIPKGGYAPVFSVGRDAQATQPARPARAAPSAKPGTRSRWDRCVGRSRVRAAATPAAGGRGHGGAPVEQARGPAIIVLPFENLAASEADEMFARGLTE